SVFAAPSREALAAPDYPSANAANRAAIGKGLSKQAYYLIPKVREVDRWLRADNASKSPPRHHRLAEAHPEAVFARAQAGPGDAPLPMRHNKKTSAGQRERIALLHKLMPGSAAVLTQAAADVSRGRAAEDDLIDAAILAWASAAPPDQRAWLPNAWACDSAGLPMRMALRNAPR
ncbi:MAG: DUF429 domain-containing protein, partial [Planctomycetota bacterium]